MNKQFWQIAVLMLLLVLGLSACGKTPETVDAETTITVESTVETAEPEIEPDPQWLSEVAIDEAYACLFPLEGEINVELAQEILLPLVEAGNAEAQYYWGYIYDVFIHYDNSDEEKESLYWYELAAEQGFTKAYLAVALNEYLDSEEKRVELMEVAQQAGIFEMSPEELGADGCDLVGWHYYDKKDYRAAMDWFLKSADLGNANSMNMIGWLYEHGLGVNQEGIVALEWFLKGAEMGYPVAMNNYGWAFLKNDYADELVNQEYADALDGYRRAAEAGDPVAMCNIGYMYDYGLGGLSTNDAIALEWYQKAADLGDARAMYGIGMIYQYMSVGVGRDFEKAMEWHLKAAEFGNRDSMAQIRTMYQFGWGVDKNEEEAQKWSDKVRDTAEMDEQGYADYSSDVERINQSAMQWLHAAADAGIAEAANNIGHYANGNPDKWYLDAADLGSENAMANLGDFYWSRGDYDAAMEWFIKAYANGYDATEWINYMLSNKQGVNAYFENYGELISTNP